VPAIVEAVLQGGPHDGAVLRLDRIFPLGRGEVVPTIVYYRDTPPPCPFAGPFAVGGPVERPPIPVAYWLVDRPAFNRDFRFVYEFIG
jgi:hypothetical protein